jgi:hypothetical protein
MYSIENYYLRSSKILSENCIKITVNQWQRYKKLEQERDY